MSANDDHFSYTDHPELAGWKQWQLRDETRFNAVIGPLAVKLIDPRRALVRMTPERRHSNLSDSTHGGALLAFMDVALFAAARSFGVTKAGGAVTVDLSTQFIGTSVIGQPIVADMELLRETGRTLFMRGLVKQEETVIASFSATVRKISPRA